MEVRRLSAAREARGPPVAPMPDSMRSKDFLRFSWPARREAPGSKRLSDWETLAIVLRTAAFLEFFRGGAGGRGGRRRRRAGVSKKRVVLRKTTDGKNYDVKQKLMIVSYEYVELQVSNFAHYQFQNLAKRVNV